MWHAPAMMKWLTRSRLLPRFRRTARWSVRTCWQCWVNWRMCCATAWKTEASYSWIIWAAWNWRLRASPLPVLRISTPRNTYVACACTSSLRAVTAIKHFTKGLSLRKGRITNACFWARILFFWNNHLEPLIRKGAKSPLEKVFNTNLTFLFDSFFLSS